MLYDDWLSDVARRFQQKFDNIQVTYNFDHGPEFEVALCELLREILPRRFGVCRGFVVGRNGERAGDDIIVFDAQHFPTLRALATDLSRKEAIPAEAVLAYIEAKHTLRVEGDETGGQSLAKALHQVEAVKSIPRPSVEHSHMLPGVNLKAGGNVTLSFQGPADHPKIRNPYYSAIWARHVKSNEPDGGGCPSSCRNALRSHRDGEPTGDNLGAVLEGWTGSKVSPSASRASMTVVKPCKVSARALSAEIGLGKRFTQKGMRRTFQDLARGAGLRDEVQRRICGHITTAMTERYSTVAQVEQREGIGKVVALMGGRPESKAKGTPASESGAPGGAPASVSGAPEEPAD